MINPIAALSPLDGRYAKSVEALRPIFSEYGLMRARVKVELNWLKALAAEPKIVEVQRIKKRMLEINDKIDNYNKTNEMIDNLEKNVGELERKVNY